MQARFAHSVRFGAGRENVSAAEHKFLLVGVCDLSAQPLHLFELKHAGRLGTGWHVLPPRRDCAWESFQACPKKRELDGIHLCRDTQHAADGGQSFRMPNDELVFGQPENNLGRRGPRLASACQHAPPPLSPPALLSAAAISSQERQRLTVMHLPLVFTV